jgi:hypothetical protein
MPLFHFNSRTGYVILPVSKARCFPTSRPRGR